MSPVKIGVFDSGLGGVSVLASLLQRFPQAHFLYYGDTANAPYGDKAPERVQAWSLAAYHHFLDRGAAAMVIACNSATSAAVEAVRAVAHIPVLGIEPALKTAVEQSRDEPIAVLATAMTIRGEKLRQLIRRFPERAAHIHPIACPGLADLIEAADYAGAQAYLADTVKPRLPAEGTPLFVLGCTHYSLIQPQIRQVFGAEARIFDGNAGLARHLRNRLPILDDAPATTPPRVEFFFTHDGERKARTARQLLQHASPPPGA